MHAKEWLEDHLQQSVSPIAKATNVAGSRMTVPWQGLGKTFGVLGKPVAGIQGVRVQYICAQNEIIDFFHGKLLLKRPGKA